MSATLQVLTAERQSLARQLAAVEAAIAALSGRSVIGPARRGPRVSGGTREGLRAGSLKDYIVRSLVREMGPKDLAAAVVRAGFKTKNKTLKTSVGNALAELAAEKHVRKVGRGRFVRG